MNQYRSNISYGKGEEVSYKGETFVALRTSSGRPPEDDDFFWKKTSGKKEIVELPDEPKNIIYRGRDGMPGRDGRDGIDGKDGEQGLPGVDGRDGIDGRDGVGLEFILQGNELGIKREDQDEYSFLSMPTPAKSLTSFIGGGGASQKFHLKTTGTGTSLAKAIKSYAATLKDIKAGSGVSFAVTDNDITISSTGGVSSVTGTTNRITVTGTTTPVVDIAATYVGQTSITTLGTIGTGVWNSTKIGLAYGGTNADLSATGGTSQVLKQTTVGGNITVGTLTNSDIGLSSVTNDAQTKASIVPNTVPSAGQIHVGNAGGTAFGVVTLSGSGATMSLASTGVLTISSIANASLANSTISGVALGGTLSALTATDTTLTFSGSYTGATARTVGLNLGNPNTWTGQQTFSTSAPIFSTTTAGRIHFSGASGILSDDAALVWDNTNKYHGVGAATPLAKLHVGNTTNTAPYGLISAQYSTNSSGANINTYKARGTEASPTILSNGDTLGQMRFWGYDGANYIEGARIQAYQSTNNNSPAATSVPTYLGFYTSTNATPSVLTQNMILTSSGSLGVGTGITSVFLTGAAKEFVLTAGTSGDAVASISLQGSRSGSNAIFGYWNFFNRGNKAATISAYTDSATDGAGLSLETSTSGTGGTTTSRLTIAPDGSSGFNIGAGTFASGVSLQINSKATTDIVLKVKGIASQSGNLTEWQNSSGTVLGAFSAGGNLYVGNNAALNGTTKEVTISGGTSGDLTSSLSMQGSRSGSGSAFTKITFFNRGNGAAEIVANTDTATDGAALIFNTSISGAAGSVTERLRIAPDGSMSINNGSNASGVGLLIKNKATGDDNLQLRQIASQTGKMLQCLNSAGSPLMQVDVNGYVLESDGAVGSPAYSFMNNTSMGMYRVANNQLGFAVAGTKYFQLEATKASYFATNIYFDNNFGFLAKDSGGTYRDMFYTDTSNNVVFGSTSYNWASVQFCHGSSTPVLKTTSTAVVTNVPVRLKGYTVATLPAGTAGDTAYCTDLLAPSLFAVAVGGGAVIGTVFYNGTNWVAG